MHCAPAGQMAAVVQVKTDFPQTIQHGLISPVPNISPYPLPAQQLGGDGRRGAPGKRIQHPIAGVAAGGDDALVQFERLLRRIADALFGLGRQRANIVPDAVHRIALHFVKVAFLPRHSGSSIVQQPAIVGRLHPLPSPAPNPRMPVPFVGQIGPVFVGIRQVVRAIAASGFRLRIAINLLHILRVVGAKGAVPGELPGFGIPEADGHKDHKSGHAHTVAAFRRLDGQPDVGPVVFNLIQPVRVYFVVPAPAVLKAGAGGQAVRRGVKIPVLVERRVGGNQLHRAGVHPAQHGQVVAVVKGAVGRIGRGHSSYSPSASHWSNDTPPVYSSGIKFQRISSRGRTSCRAYQVNSVVMKTS